MSTHSTGSDYLVQRVQSQRRATLIQVAALLGAGACLAGAAMLQEPINQQRRDLELVLHSNIYQDLPPEYAWVSAAGGTFRGIAADILWARAEQLKQDGKYFESHQLAKWICTLQPRFAAVWSFQAWNMSYNISVGTHTALERWQWVYNGIRLLRDEGIPNNPRVVPLYHQLAWTWFHKVGDRADDFHQYYKTIWAATMQIVLGQPPLAATSAQAIDWFRPIAEAPRGLNDLTAARPGTAALIEQLGQLGIDVLAGTTLSRIHHPLEDQLLRPYAQYLEEAQVRQLRSATQPATEAGDDARQKLFAFFDAAPADDFAALIAFVRSKVLREQYKMDPQYMLDLTGQFGTDEPVPIDWRTPWAQSLYWSKYGIEQGGGLGVAKEFDILNTDRITLFSLANLAKQGRFVVRLNPDKPGESFFWMSPDNRYIEAMHRKYLELGKKHADEGEEVGNTAGETLRSGHVNNLRAGIVNLYLAGQRDEAAKYLQYLAVNYPDQYTGQTNPDYTKGLDDFVIGELGEMVGTYADTIYTISGTLRNAYLSLALGERDEYLGKLQLGGQIWKKHQEGQRGTPRGRLLMLKFEDLQGIALGFVVIDPNIPLVYRSLAWREALDDIKRRCYDLIHNDLVLQCQQEGLDPAKAFPEPPDMEQWRKDNPHPMRPEDLNRELQGSDVDAPTAG